jgi:acetylornithine/N-succinyldiaminopimelate aminotransferase
MNSMEAVLQQAEQCVMQTYHRFPLALDHGEGMYVWDIEGKKYLDFVAGIAVNSLGYSHERLCKTIAEQAAKLIHCSNLYYTQPQVALAKALTQHSDFDKVFFCNSGAESIESALKLARKYAAMKQKAGNDIITMEQSFHGRTYGAVTATGQSKYQKGLSPLLPGIHHVPFNDFEALEKAAGESVCAILLEPIQGESGIIPANQEYLKKVRALCDERDILLIFDEVQAGVGRTGELFAYQTYGVVPDMATFAKGLAGGIPIGALMAKEFVAKAFAPGDHASTFGGNSLAASAGVVVLEELFEHGLLENVKKQGAYLTEKLKELQAKHSCIQAVRGIGLMQGIALTIPTGAVVQKAMEKGLLLVGAGADVIRFVPALIVQKEHIDEMCAILDEVLGDDKNVNE